MKPSPRLTAISLPVPLTELGFPDPLQAAGTAIASGDAGWHWEPDPPALPIPPCGRVSGTPVPGWDLDHLVVLVPSLDEAVGVLGERGLQPRLRLSARGRPTAFFRIGPLLEIIESPVRVPSLYGIALVTDEPLEVVAIRWAGMGRDVSDPRPALQPGRRILTVRDVAAGFAVMSPDRQAPAASRDELQRRAPG